LKKSLLLTGGRGFLGRHLRKAWEARGNPVISIGRGEGNELRCDLVKEQPELPHDYDYVVHAAGLAHREPRSSEEEQAFFELNVGGTERLLKSLEQMKLPQQLVFISTVAVYGEPIPARCSEEHPRKGESPYALSKIEAEDLVEAWGIKHGVATLIFRLPLIAGANPPGNLGRLIRGLRKGPYLRIAGGQARRSAVLAEDVANFIAQPIAGKGTYNLTDDVDPRFREFEERIMAHYGTRQPLNLNGNLAAYLAWVGDRFPAFPFNKNVLAKMTMDMTFDCQKAKKELGWQPRPVINNWNLA